MNILNDLFTGWKHGTMGRLRFFLYFLFMTVVSLFLSWFSVGYLSGYFTLFIGGVGAVFSYYSGLLVFTKRYRELVPFPVIFALLHWGAGGLAFWKAWQWLNLVCAVALLMLFATPRCRIITDEKPSLP